MKRDGVWWGVEGSGAGWVRGILSMHVEGLTLNAYNKKKKIITCILFNYFLYFVVLVVTVNSDLLHSLSFFFFSLSLS